MTCICFVLYEREELSKNKRSGKTEKIFGISLFIKEKLRVFSCFFQKKRKKAIDKLIGMVYNKNQQKQPQDTAVCNRESNGAL